MYGLLLQSVADCLKDKYGDDVWEKIRHEVGMQTNVFATHNIYSEKLMVQMATAAAKITGDDFDEIMYTFGTQFVSFVGQFGYDRILKVLGRHLRDFLNGLDNLHEYLRFSYPKLKPPSFFVNDETKNGLTLTYRSKRTGYTHYVRGQISQVSRLFYHTKVDIYVVASDYDESTKTSHVKFRLIFNNKAFREVANHLVDNVVDNVPLRSEILFELFPFHIVFCRKMGIRSVGPGLRAVMPEIIGKSLVEFFHLERPLTKFTWEAILLHTNNVFQLSSKKSHFFRMGEPINAGHKDDTGDHKDSEKDSDTSSTDMCKLSLKGQMMFMYEWDSIMFLGTPQMNSLDDMFKSGLYINDLSMHDSSRDLVLAGTQQSAELKLALDQEQEKSRLLEQSMMKLDQEMQRTDALLYQMIPKPVADRLRKGEPSVATCQVFDQVTILFSDVVGFTNICSQITPMQVVSMLNAMYTQFDHLSENHSVYKVETIGDAYMAVSGAPTVTKYHALHMCDMALDMREAMDNLPNPATQETMKIRMGIHSGTVVAGVVGIKMPRYCLFGDTVNTTSRMETNGEAMKIHISETTKAELEGFPYQLEKRGTILVKGKGDMNTYWLKGKLQIGEDELPKCPFVAIMEDEILKRQKDEERGNLFNRNLDCDPSEKTYSTSPMLAYSPVTYEDMNDVTKSPRPTGSANSRRDSLNSHSSPSYRQRSNTVACPFSRSFSHQPNTGTLSPDHSQQPYSKAVSPTSHANKSSSPKPVSDEVRNASQKTSTKSQQQQQKQYQQKPSVPESIDSGIIVNDNSLQKQPRTNSDTTSHPLGHNLPKPHSLPREDSPSSQRPSGSHRPDGIARIVPIVSKTSDTAFDSIKNDHASQPSKGNPQIQGKAKGVPVITMGDEKEPVSYPDAKSDKGNGSIGSYSPKSDGEKRYTMTPNGTHGSDSNAVSVIDTRQSKSHRKSKTCEVL